MIDTSALFWDNAFIAMKSLAEFSVKNHLLINVISFFLVGMGIVAITKQLNREAFPNVTFDIVTISTAYPGAVPEEIEKLITIPIEKELKQVDDIKDMHSVSAEGISVITLVLEEAAKDKRAVVDDIQRAVDNAENMPSDLPDKPRVDEIRTRDNPIIEVALTGDFTETELREHARNLEKRYLDLDDVSRVARKGYRERQIIVEVSPQSAWQNYVSLTEVAAALAAQNKSVPGGKFYENGVEHILRTTGEFKDEQDVARTVVRAGLLGKGITTANVAHVAVGFEEESVIEKNRGKRSITLVVIKKESGDAIDLVDEVKAITEEYLSQASGLNVSYVNDLSFFIRRRLNVLYNNGLMGLVMVAVSLFIFLSPGTALSACLGIPTALLTTFALMNVFGISINLISLFGLIMVLGMLVDEDIVISENVHRHLEAGMSSQDAAVKGAREVSGAVISTVLTTIAAFIPLLLMGGTMGKFTRNIPMVVIITLACSLLEALFILPSHISEFSRQTKGTAKADRGKLFHRLENSYRRTLIKVLKHRYLATLILVAVFFASLVVAVTQMKFILFPSGGVEMFFVRVESLAGDSLEETEKKIRVIEDLIAKLPEEELDTFSTVVGRVQNDPNDPLTVRGSHVGQIQVFLTPEADRERTSAEIAEALKPKIAEIPGFKEVSVDQFRHGPPVGRPVEIRVLGENYSVIEEIAEKYKAFLAGIKGVTDIRDDYEEGKHEKRILIDPVKASQAGLTVENVALTVRQAFEGVTATTITSTEEEIDVIVRYPTAMRHDADALAKLLIPNNKGLLVPLATVADFANLRSVQSIKHFDGDRTVNVTANVKETVVTSEEVARKLSDKMADVARQYPGYKIRFGGEFEETQESMKNLTNAFAISLALILIILIVMFKSLLQTFAVMFTIPFSVIGVILAFMAHGEPLSFLSLMGLIGLTGIVVDGATIMIDFINRFREDGMDLNESILKGSVMRLRAVVLTSLTTVLGVLPSSYGFGGNDPFVAPMALAINYGIIFSTVLTLLYIPVFVAIIDDIKKLPAWGKRQLQRQ